MSDFDFSPNFYFSRAVDYDEEEDEANRTIDWCVFVVSTMLLHGLSKNRRDNDETGRSIPPATGGHIVALMTRRGGRRVDGTA